MTDFIDEHPGGKALIVASLGKDMTSAFNGGIYNHSNASRNLMSSLRVGIISGGGEIMSRKINQKKSNQFN